MLLVLDNLEQVTEIGPFLSDLLRSCLHLRLLVTSRRPLHVQEEQEFPLGPLPLPDMVDAPSTAHLAQNAAVHLFVQRSQAVLPDFSLTDANAPAISEICHRLDGLPLAIELGAARSRLLPPAALLARLDTRLALLTGGGSDRPGRHQTMRDAIAWSYDLLHPHEQAAFRSLSVCAGGVTLAAAEAVAKPSSGSAAATSVATLDFVTVLVDASLLRPDRAHGDEPRFTMLETIREFGLEQLRACGEAADVAERHAHFFLQVAEVAAASQRGSGQVAHLAALEAEQENLRAALHWAMAAPQRAELALRLADALFWYWYLRGHFREGRYWLELAIAASPGEPSPLLARVLCSASVLAYRQGDYAAGRNWQMQSAELCRALGDLTSFAHALHYVAVGHLLPGDEATLLELIPQSVSQFRASGDRWGLATALSALGMQALVQQRHDDAAAPFAESEAICRQSGDTWGLARVLHYSGELARHHGDFAQARRHYEESLLLLGALEHRFSAATILHNLGYVAMHQGDVPAAMRAFADALEQHLRYGNQNNVAHCLGGIAGIAGRLGRPQAAARLFGAAASLLDAAGAGVWPIDAPDYERNLAAVRRQLGETAFNQAFVMGHQRPLDESLAEARHEAALAATPETPVHAALSPRQQEILRLLCAGDSDREIGAALHIGRRTVETHIAAIYTKLGAHNRAEAAAIAVRLGLI
jgi:predicted ATPase/DNA-binding CsgD family transcriptional regulator